MKSCIKVYALRIPRGRSKLLFAEITSGTHGQRMGATPVPQGALGRIPDGPGLSGVFRTLPLSSGYIRTTAGFSGDFWTLSSRKTYQSRPKTK